MTDGLAILGGWLQLAVVVGVVLCVVLRRRDQDP